MKGMLWASERMISGEKKKMVENLGKSWYNRLSFQGHSTLQKRVNV